MNSTTFNADTDNQLREVQREFFDFLDDQSDQGIYFGKIKHMITQDKSRLIINMNHLRDKKPDRAKALMTTSYIEIPALERAVQEMVATVDSAYASKFITFHVGLEGSFGANHVTPRTLSSRFLGQLVCVEGIVTRMSVIRPKVVKSVHYCPETQKMTERRYADMTSLDAQATTSAYPTKDDDGHALETEYGLCAFKDYQTFTVQEMPEKAPTGQLPRSVDIVADSDLVDACKPGDRVQVVGTFRCLPGKKNGFTSGSFKTLVIANHVSVVKKDADPVFSPEDVKRIRNLSRQNKNVFDLLASSLAPSIHGHEFIKKAVLCMMLGGTERILENGTRIRGDINVLLIGDPSVAKSQMLRYVLQTAPRAISTTGRGSSGVGLTAAVTTDHDSGERHLEAGAMVLADRGIVCIDEFDKMSDIDRTAIHEVMEQGRVTIAKAGIHAKLNARCSVLAAANPVYGRYDQYKTPMENIGLQDSLLSRFDLLFIVLDRQDMDADRRIADHVLRIHQYRCAREQDGDVLPLITSAEMLSTAATDADKALMTQTPMYEKYDERLYGTSRSRSDKILSMEFMRKYIHIARAVQPKLTDEASEFLSNEYSELRREADSCGKGSSRARTQPITARTLETMLRLATAHAKARISKTVDLPDAESALELIRFACFKDVLRKRRKGDAADDDDSDEDEEFASPRRPTRAERFASRTEAAMAERPDSDEAMEVDDGDDRASGDDEAPDAATARAPLRDRLDISDVGEPRVLLAAEKSSGVDVPPELFASFRSELNAMFGVSQMVQLARVREHMQSKFGGENFNDDLLFAAIEKMQSQNQVMLAEGTVYRI